MNGQLAYVPREGAGLDEIREGAKQFGARSRMAQAMGGGGGDGDLPAPNPMALRQAQFALMRGDARPMQELGRIQTQVMEQQRLAKQAAVNQAEAVEGRKVQGKLVDAQVADIERKAADRQPGGFEDRAQAAMIEQNRMEKERLDQHRNDTLGFQKDKLKVDQGQLKLAEKQQNQAAARERQTQLRAELETILRTDPRLKNSENAQRAAAIKRELVVQVRAARSGFVPSEEEIQGVPPPGPQLPKPDVPPPTQEQPSQRPLSPYERMLEWLMKNSRNGG
jgi:hypothetical protein